MIAVRRSAAFTVWLAALRDRTARVRIAARLDRIEHGVVGDVKSLGGGLSEIRVSYGPGYRLYCTWQGQRLVILLSGGDKSTQMRDITTARRMLAALKD